MTRSKYGKISEEQKALIVKMYKKGTLVKTIATAAGVCISTVTYVAKNAGVKVRGQGGGNKWNEDKKTEALMIIAAGGSSGEAQRKTGVPRSTVLMWAKDNKGRFIKKEGKLSPSPYTQDQDLITRQTLLKSLFKPSSIAL